MHQDQVMAISEVRAIAALFIREQPVFPRAVQSARGTVHMMCYESDKYGLTTAEVIRAVLHPTLEERPGCDYPHHPQEG